MNFTKPLGYIQPWRTCKELQWQCFTDFSTVRRQSWCGMDAVLVQFMQLLLRWHSKNLQNSLKKIGSVQHKIELVCYSTGFLTSWDNRPAFKHPVNNLALPVASHRKGLSQNVKQENNSSSIRACCCPLDTHLELTGNTKGTLLMISWRAVSDWHIRVDPVSFPAQVSSSFRAFGRLFFPLLLMWWELWFHHITRSPSSHKVKTSSNYSKTCKKTFTFQASMLTVARTAQELIPIPEKHQGKNHWPFSCEGKLPLLIEFSEHTVFSSKASVGCSFWFILFYCLNCLWWKSNWTVVRHMYGNPGQGENAKWVIVSVKADNFNLSFPLSSSATLFYWGSMEHSFPQRSFFS